VWRADEFAVYAKAVGVDRLVTHARSRAVTGERLVAAYTWNARGQRAVTATTAGVTREVFDPVTGRPVTVVDVSGSTDFVWSPSGVLLGSIAANAPPVLYSSDRLGSVTEAFDVSGNVVWRGRYGPTGVRTDIAGQGPRFGFTGGEHDVTGLVYLSNRFLDPVHGWFTQTDPLPNVYGIPAMGGYVYANNQPTRLVDPSGLRAETNCGLRATIKTYLGQMNAAAGCSLADVFQDHLADGRAIGRVALAVGKRVIIPIAVAVLCTAVTGGVGAVGCAIAGGIIMRIADNMLDHKPAFQGAFDVKKIAIDVAIEVATLGVGHLLKYTKAARNAAKYSDDAVQVAEDIARNGDEIAGAADNIASETDNIAGEIDVFHATDAAGKAQSIVDGIDVKYLSDQSRFGKAFHVAEDSGTTLAELAHHGVTPSHGIRFQFDASKARVLDFTNPRIAKKWGYGGGDISGFTRSIGPKALASGYNAIRFPSLRSSGVNWAILTDFNELLKPVMITPIPKA
jgi:RHS repeat-associated protein